MKEAQSHHENPIIVFLRLALKHTSKIDSFICYISTIFFLSHLTLSVKAGGVQCFKEALQTAHDIK